MDRFWCGRLGELPSYGRSLKNKPPCFPPEVMAVEFAPCVLSDWNAFVHTSAHNGTLRQNSERSAGAILRPLRRIPTLAGVTRRYEQAPG